MNAVARAAEIDPAYVFRLEKGGPKSHIPTRGVVLALAGVFDLSPSETDRLLYAAGLAPQEDWQTRAVKAEVALVRIRQAIEDLDDEGLPDFIKHGE